jgi:hypothetical protein
MFTKIFEVKKWLNMNSKLDNKCENRDDIILLSEIIGNSKYWQAIFLQAFLCYDLLDYYNVVHFS